MKLSRFFLFCFTLLVIAQTSWAVTMKCSDFLDTQDKAYRKKLAKNLIDLGLDEHAYLAKWKFTKAEGQGPFANSGEALVVGLKADEEELWMSTIGKNSIGIMISGLPDEAQSTAFLRIGNRFYSEDRIREGRQPRDFLNDVLKIYSRTRGYTEATFIVSPSEMKLILEFIEARGAREIIAKFDVKPKGPLKGTPIHPTWTHTGIDLKHESCAAAVLSFVDEKWLAHYDPTKANKLRALQKRLNLNWTHVARRGIWENFRNPSTSYITLHRIDASKTKSDLLTSSFMKSMGWGGIRGLYKYAFIPDNPNTGSDKFTSSRISLHDYLKR